MSSPEESRLRVAVETAYALARTQVYDLEPHGPGPRTERQKQLVADLERAEQALTDYRHERYAQVPQA